MSKLLRLSFFLIFIPTFIFATYSVDGNVFLEGSENHEGATISFYDLVILLVYI